MADQKGFIKLKGSLGGLTFYDKNGNIMSLIRNGGEEIPTNTVRIDSLTYTYEDPLHSNKLKKSCRFVWLNTRL